MSTTATAFMQIEATETRDAPVDGPRPGRWELTGVSSDPRRAAPRLAGHLEVSADAAARLFLSIESEAPVVIDARLTHVDPDGDTRFQGSITASGLRSAVDVAGRFHGVFRDGARDIAWWTLRAEWAMPAAGRRWRLTRGRTLRRRVLELGVNAERELAR